MGEMNVPDIVYEKLSKNAACNKSKTSIMFSSNSDGTNRRYKVYSEFSDNNDTKLYVKIKKQA